MALGGPAEESSRLRVTLVLPGAALWPWVPGDIPKVVPRLCTAASSPGVPRAEPAPSASLWLRPARAGGGDGAAGDGPALAAAEKGRGEEPGPWSQVAKTVIVFGPHPFGGQPMNTLDRPSQEARADFFYWTDSVRPSQALLGMLVLCLSIAYSVQDQLGAVYTEGGFVEGVNKKLGLLGDYVDIFKGIPYAAAPKPLENPQRHPGWQGTLKAKNFKKRCLQATITQDSTYGKEDCLYLNIWVPQGRKEELNFPDISTERGGGSSGVPVPAPPTSVSRNLPVMIWIYGGAFLMGSSHGANFLSNYLYDGEEIATRGNVIVVSFNYRVGPLGFLSTGDSNLPGNYGLRDQHMAIAWVKRNIAAFGGDPDNITVFGESAGGASASLQTLSPYNKGLIKRAISQSGVALCPWAIQKNPLFWAKRIAEKVGCPLNDTGRMARCLKITDPRALILAYKMPLAGTKYPLLHYLGFLPVIDGDFIPSDPVNLYANAADIDYIAGTNDMDGHIFASVEMPAISKDKQAITEYPPVGMGWRIQCQLGLCREDFYKLVSGLTITKGPRGANATFDVYTKPWAQDSSQETKKKTVVHFETDVLFLMPTEIAVAQHKTKAK
ncbi:hypothetical protein J1605_019632 [Eschrichtius robustus]|uniref:Carboxylic ester hydrolase n=1 Tax=Eschrichtius robustus TaxID=9764 RepID=A0AB34HJT2_ESCRO|nr:hypothetical protein J1605_019632 [Eschrichtius robustus]